MKNIVLNHMLCGLLITVFAGCSTPEEKAQKYYEKGMELLETDPAKAKLEFQNALQMKKNMTAAIYGMALAAEKQADWQACFVILNKVLAEEPNHIGAIIKVGQLFLAAGDVKKAKENLDKALSIDDKNLETIVLQASIALKEKNFPFAVEKANEILSRDPNNTDALMIIASERYAAKDAAATLAAIDKGLKINKKNLMMHLFKIQVLESSSEVLAVENAYKALLEVFPDNHMARTKLAEFYFNNNKKPEAERELRLLVEKQPNQLEPKLNLAKFLSATKGVGAGVKALENMAEEAPDDYDLNFYLVGLYEQQNNFESANNLLNKIIKNAGDKPEGLKAKVKVASRLLGKNKKPEAIKLIDQILESDSGQQEALLLKAGIALEEQRFDDAVLDLRTVLRDQPNQSQAHLMLAKAYEFAGSTALAEESYVKAIESGKANPNYAVAYAKYLLNKNETQRAEKVLEEAFNKQPKHVETIKLLAQIKIATDDLQGAQSLAGMVKNLNTGNLSELIQGSILAKRNDYQGSINAFMRAHEAAPNDMQAIYAIVRTHLFHKKNNEAINFLESQVARLPENYELRLVLAQVFAQSGNISKAKDTYDRAIALAPKKSAGYQLLSYLAMSQRDIPLAKSTLQKGLEAIPNSFDLKLLQAEIYQNEDDIPKALRVYEDLMNSNPDSQVALNNYVSLVADNETDQSKLDDAYQKSQKLKSSKTPQFLDTLGWISYRAGKLDEAEDALKNAIKVMPKYAIFHYHLGKVYWDKNDKKRAKESFEKALELDSNASFKADINNLLKEV